MSFQQGLSGLNASAKALDVVGNNIANANTVGFKSAETHFSDVFANSLAGSGASQIGIGAAISAIQQTFSQGNVTATNNPLDISINGGGFFRMDRAGAITYTRNGQFHLDNAGYIVNDQEMRVMGYPADAQGTITQSTPVDLQISASQIPPRATSDPLSGNVIAALNLDSRETVPTVTPFSISNPQSYNFSTALSVYDTLGNAHTMTLYAVKTAVAGQWVIHSNVDGSPEANSPLTDSILTFNSSGKLTASVPPATTLGVVSASINLNAVGAAQTPPVTNSAVSPLVFNIDFNASTQFGSASSVDRLVQGGYSSGALTGLSAGADGVIVGRYSNGQARNLGQVVLATFANPNGLQSLGNNQWALSSVSGPELIGAPGAGSRGVLQSSSIEESNVDLTAELVNMITQQRNYQANAQSIKTQDQIMQTLVNLR
jgi:flagellar hook protein FlgE